MSAKTVIHKVSALSENSKMASLSQNVVRHMRNTYVGESSRSGYERTINHMDNYKARHKDSHMWGHALAHHGGRMDLKFKFVVVKTFQKALTQQISEAVSTRKRGEDFILNKKFFLIGVRCQSWQSSTKAKCGSRKEQSSRQSKKDQKLRAVLRT